MLLDEFEAKELVPGRYQRPVPVGHSFHDADPGVTLKEADALCETPDGTYWVFEAEAELNYTAIGQAKVYQYLFSMDHPGVEVRAAIVCGSARKDLWAACKENGIEVFVIELRTPVKPE